MPNSAKEIWNLRIWRPIHAREVFICLLIENTGSKNKKFIKFNRNKIAYTSSNESSNKGQRDIR